MTIDVTIEEDERRTDSIDRRTVLGALSLGFVAAACRPPGAGGGPPLETPSTVDGAPGVTLPTPELPGGGEVPPGVEPNPAPGESGVPVPDTPLPLGSGVEEIRVANRSTFGITPEVNADIAARGTANFLTNQLSLTTPAAEVETALAAELATIGATRQEQFGIVTDGKEDELGRTELTLSNLYRAVNSPNQLFEVMSQFWMNHFNVNLQDNELESLVTAYQEEAIRPLALGNFADLLRATAEHPAMLLYLDAATNNANDRDGINENYGREILELHTFGNMPPQYGLEPVYDIEEIRAAASIFTGWTFDMNQDSPTFLEFEFNPEFHTEDDHTLLEFSSAGLEGKAAADALIDYLAAHPSTARYLSFKLLVHFVGDEPPIELIDSTAAVFTANDGEIVPTLTHIFESAEFAASDGMKLRRPFETLAATFRSSGVDIPLDPASQTAIDIRTRVAEMGNEPWMKETPDGYSDYAEEWLSTSKISDHWNTAAEIVTGQLTEDLVPDIALLRGDAATAGDLVLNLGAQFGLGAISPETSAAILTAIDVAAGTAAADLQDEDVQTVAALLFAHPLFQIR